VIDAWDARWLDRLNQDLRFAVRTLRRTPGFTLSALVTIAVGVASTTAMFAVMNGVLLRPLPVREQDRLVVIWTEDRKSGVDHFPFSYGAFAAFRNQLTSFASLAGTDFNGAWTIPCQIGDATLSLRGGIVAGNYFGTLGVKALVGRVLTDSDDVVGGPRVVVISQDVWRNQFAGDDHVVGKTLRLNGVAYTVVGVIPREFEYPRGAQLWTTLALVVPQWVSQPTQPALDLIGRLKPGTTVAAAQAEVLNATRIGTADGKEWRPVFRSFSDMVVGDVRRPVLVLSAAALLVLILASLNVGSLLLVRGEARAYEFAIRSAIGAGRWRVVRQLVTETVFLCVVGGIVGALLAYWGLQVFRAIAPANLPRADELHIDAAALAFALLASFVAAFLAGYAPARALVRADLGNVLRGGSNPRASYGWRRIAVVGQIALALLVLTEAGLLSRSFARLASVDTGFGRDGLLFVTPWLPPGKYSNGQQVADLIDRLVIRTRGLPGVTRATAVSHLPFSLNGIDMSYSVEGQDRRSAAANPLLTYVSATPDYFQTLDVPLRQGRGFSERDRAGAPLVVVVSETVARRMWPGQEAIGKRLKLGPPDYPDPWRTVVGVAADTRYRDLLDTRSSLYVPDRQPPGADEVWVPTILVLRSQLPKSQLLSVVREAIRSVDRDVTIMSAADISDLIAPQLARPRFNAGLLDILAIMALILAVTGLYGVIATDVAQRTREIGVRIALGASGGTVAKQVVRQGMSLAVAGAALGLGAAVAASRLLAGMLFEVKPADPLTMFGVPLLLLLVAFGACHVLARRAGRISPMVALRYE